MLTETVGQSLVELKQKFRERTGKELIAVTQYVSVKEQARKHLAPVQSTLQATSSLVPIYRGSPDKELPGCSYHNYGLAIEFQFENSRDRQEFVNLTTNEPTRWARISVTSDRYVCTSDRLYEYATADIQTLQQENGLAWAWKKIINEISQLFNQMKAIDGNLQRDRAKLIELQNTYDNRLNGIRERDPLAYSKIVEYLSKYDRLLELINHHIPDHKAKEDGFKKRSDDLKKRQEEIDSKKRDIEIYTGVAAVVLIGNQFSTDIFNKQSKLQEKVNKLERKQREYTADSAEFTQIGSEITSLKTEISNLVQYLAIARALENEQATLNSDTERYNDEHEKWKNKMDELNREKADIERLRSELPRYEDDFIALLENIAEKKRVGLDLQQLLATKTRLGLQIGEKRHLANQALESISVFIDTIILRHAAPGSPDSASNAINRITDLINSPPVVLPRRPRARL